MARYARPGQALKIAYDSPTTGLTGTFGVTIIDADTEAVVVARSTANIAEIPAGSGIYRWEGFAPAVGSYLVVGDDGTATPAGTTAEALEVTVSGLPALAGAAVGGGPCSLWTTEEAVGECCDAGEGADLAYAVQVATAMLWEMSGRRYSGACRATVRPHQQFTTCGPRGWYRRGRGPWGCRALDDVLLAGYPVREVEEVKVDGVVLDPTAYMLVEDRRLLRTDGTWWPSCQYLERGDDEDGTFFVTYTYGADPPLTGRHAATKLACEIAKSCADLECALPENTSRVVRQGVEVAVDAARALPGGLGLQEVDAFLRVAGGPGRRRPAVVSPDSRRYPLVVSTGPAT